MIDLALTFAADGMDYRVYADGAWLGQSPPPGMPVRRVRLDHIREQVERRDPRAEEDAELVKLGRDLFKETFQDEVGWLYHQAEATAGAQRTLLRVQLRFGDHSYLHTVPWELLHDGSRFIAKHPDCAVVRDLQQLGRRGSLQVEPPLRLLLTSASPAELAALNLAEEEAGIRLAYQQFGRRVEITVERRLSLRRLSDLLIEAEAAMRPFHVWHHAGHGGTTQARTDFWLSLEHDGHSERATIKQVGDVVGVCSDLRLVVLNCCHASSLVGLAPELARLNVPVVIGFPRSISDPAAVRFATVLHGCMTRLPVEHAVSLARRTMNPGSQEWSLPLLLSRRSDQGNLLPPEPPPPIPRTSGRQARRVKRPEPGAGTGRRGIELDGVTVGSIGVIGVRQTGGDGAHPPVGQPDVSVKSSSIGSIGVVGLEQINAGPLGASEEALGELLARVRGYLDSGS